MAWDLKGTGNNAAAAAATPVMLPKVSSCARSWLERRPLVKLLLVRITLRLRLTFSHAG